MSADRVREAWSLNGRNDDRDTSPLPTSQPMSTQQPVQHQTTLPPNYEQYHSPQHNLEAGYYAPENQQHEWDRDSIVAPSFAGTEATLLPTYANAAGPDARWARYGSEEKYLAALRAWADDKRYMDRPKDKSGRLIGVDGYYGARTMNDIANQPRPEFRKRKSVSTAAGQSSGRRGSAANTLQLQSSNTSDGMVAPNELGESAEEGDLMSASDTYDRAADLQQTPATRSRRRSSLGDWLRRKRTNSFTQT